MDERGVLLVLGPALEADGHGHDRSVRSPSPRRAIERRPAQVRRASDPKREREVSGTAHHARIGDLRQSAHLQMRAPQRRAKRAKQHRGDEDVGARSGRGQICHDRASET